MVPVIVINDLDHAVPPVNYKEYLKLKNIACVGGSWLAPADAMAKSDWQKITKLAQMAVA